MDKQWKRKERELGKLLWQYDEPSEYNKPRTGDIKGLGADAESRRWVGESKYSTKDSFRVTKDILDKIVERAKNKKKLPVLMISLPYKSFFILDEQTFEELIETYKLYQNQDFNEKLGNKDLVYAMKNLKENIKRVIILLEKGG